MADKVTNEERLNLSLLHSRAETAAARAELALAAFAAYADKMFTQYGLDPACDSIDAETGAIKRAKPTAEPAKG